MVSTNMAPAPSQELCIVLGDDAALLGQACQDAFTKWKHSPASTKSPTPVSRRLLQGATRMGSTLNDPRATGSSAVVSDSTLIPPGPIDRWRRCDCLPAQQVNHGSSARSGPQRSAAASSARAHTAQRTCGLLPAPPPLQHNPAPSPAAEDAQSWLRFRD